MARKDIEFECPAAGRVPEMALLFHAAAIGRGPEDFELRRPDGRSTGDMSLYFLTTPPELGCSVNRTAVPA